MKNLTSVLRTIILSTALIFLFTTNSFGLEFQHQYDIPSMTDRKIALKIWETVEEIKGVLDIDVNLERKYLFVTYDDTYVDEDAIKEVIEKAGYKVRRVSLMLEPREGVMN